MNATPPSLTRDLAATMDWWRDAGVDLDFVDDATAWSSDESDEASSVGRADGAKSSTKAQISHQDQASGQIDELAANAPTRIDLLGDSPPTTLEEFFTFWLEAPGLDTIGPRGRVPPRGPANAELMVLVVDPEARDTDRLLSGEHGELLSNLLTATGLDETQVYIASALPRHTPMADTQALANGGIDAILTKHIELASPKRVIALGTNILPLLGHDPSKEFTSLREINQVPAKTPILVSEGLDAMIAMPRLKARFWRRWIEWSAGQ